MGSNPTQGRRRAALGVVDLFALPCLSTKLLRHVYTCVIVLCVCLSAFVCLVAFQEYEDDESGESDDEEGPKLRSTLPPWSNPVPLGWPKVNTSLYTRNPVSHTQHYKPSHVDMTTTDVSTTVKVYVTIAWLFNPRSTCAAKVTVLGLCVRLSARDTASLQIQRNK